MENKLTHFDNSGNARMVDVSEKKGTVRVATAVSKIKMSKETLELIKQGKIGKGDVLGVARVAGIMASKQTANLIPMCHPLMITSCNVDFEINKEENSIEITATVKNIASENKKQKSKPAVHFDEVDMEQISLFDTVKDDDVIEELKSIQLDELRPVDALNILYRLQNKLKNRW